MTEQQSTAKYCDNVLLKQDNKYRPRTIGKFAKLPPMNLENLKNQAPLSTINSSKKLQGPISLQERLEKARNNDSLVYTTEKKSNSWKNLELIGEAPISNNDVQTTKNENQDFSKDVYKSTLSQAANDNLISLREPLASSDTIPAPIEKTNYYMNSFGSMQTIYQNEDFDSMPSIKSKSLEYLNYNNHTPVNKLEGKVQGRNESWSLCKKVWPINAQLKQMINNRKFVCSCSCVQGLPCSTKEYSNPSHLNYSLDARLTWAMSCNLYSPHQLSSTHQTYSPPKLGFIPTFDEDLYEINDQVIPLDTITTETTQSVADRCFKEALEDCKKYQRVEEQKKKSSKPSIRPQKSNVDTDTNESNSDEEANGCNKNDINLSSNRDMTTDKLTRLWHNLQACANRKKSKSTEKH